MSRVVDFVCFDVGYTLLDETRSWRAWASHLEISPDELLQGVREGIRRGVRRPQRQALECRRPGVDVDVPPPTAAYIVEDIYPDARTALPELRAAGFRLGAAGNMRAETEGVLLRSGLPLHCVGSSERWAWRSPTQPSSSGLYELPIPRLSGSSTWGTASTTMWSQRVGPE